MRIAFRAIDGGFVEDEDVVGFNFSGMDEKGQEHYVSLQRSAEGGDPEEDWGIYLEFDERCNSGYGNITQCLLSRDLLALDLGKAPGRQPAKVEGVDVALSGINDEAYAKLRAGLPRVFRDFEKLLVLS